MEGREVSISDFKNLSKYSPLISSASNELNFKTESEAINGENSCLRSSSLRIF